MIPDMSEALEEWEIDIVHKRYTITSVNFVDTTTEILNETIKAVLQPASPDELTALGVDLSLRHLKIHSTTELLFGDYIEYGGVSYKIINPSDYQLYGFSEVIGEEVKGAIT